MSEDFEWAHLLYLLLALVIVGWGGLRFRAFRPLRALKYALLWLLIIGALALGYTFRGELDYVAQRVMAELIPQRGEFGPQTASFRAGEAGHFVVTAQVDGTDVEFLVDTGATHVVLSPKDASLLGMDPDQLDYRRRYNTANGIGLGAPVVLNRVTIGPIELTGVQAAVNQAPMGRSLLGMSFLSRIERYEVRDGRLTLWR